jgi:glycosyltransferase involved in cell wall biosynthesis
VTQPALRWVCCQIGRREHYAIPRALQRRAVLAELITDFWAGGIFAATPGRRSRERHHDELRSAPVWAPNTASLMLETSLRVSRQNGWDAILRRNEWFQTAAAGRIEHVARRHDAGRTVCFAYSYAAARVFRAARAHGWTTVLGQIDPGPVEERLVAGLHQRAPHLEPGWQPAPAAYWDSWRDECALADRIIVNSTWSRDALCEAGVPVAKIRVIPLAYERPTPAPAEPPARTAGSHRLRVLFLGQVTIRKGIVELIEAADLLRGKPVQFIVAGPMLMTLPVSALQHPHITWVGSVPGTDIAKWFAEADVLILPTHSDGFGLTQLEALGHHVPVIASTHCGRVVEDGVNGVVLPEVSGQAIAAAIRTLLGQPALLREMRRQAVVGPSHTLAAIGDALDEAVA